MVEVDPSFMGRLLVRRVSTQHASWSQITTKQASELILKLSKAQPCSLALAPVRVPLHRAVPPSLASFTALETGAFKLCILVNSVFLSSLLKIFMEAKKPYPLNGFIPLK